MKKTLVSLAAVAALSTGAMAADKGIDFTVTGQAVIYYETKATDAANDPGFFDRDNSNANVGVQLNLDSDLGNNFSFGSQFSYLGTAGLNRNLVGDTNVKQFGGSVPITQTVGSSATTDDLALTKIFVAKKVGNTTVKIGRQELPKSLSPLAYTEGWTVFKNTFEAVLVVNSDLPDTTVVLASVGGSTKTTGNGLMEVSNLKAPSALGVVDVNGAAYMLTVQNKSLPMTTLTGSYYALSEVAGAAGNGVNALWIDAKVAGKDLPLGLKVGVQYGSIAVDLATAPTAKDTTAMGLKVSLKPIDALNVCLAYSSVDDGAVEVRNLGTGVKTPLFTQMIYNQNFISSDNTTILLKGAYSLGDAGSIIAQYGATTDDSAAKADYNELDVMYKVKAGGVQYFAAYISRDIDGFADNKIRFWGRYAF